MLRVIKIFILFCWCPYMVLSAFSHVKDVKEDTLSFFKRFSFHTNAVDWLLVTPNAGVELDLQGTPRTHYSILVNGKYNWNTRHSVSPRIVYNIGSVTVEARKYWRTGGRWEGHRFKPFSRYTATDERHTSQEVSRDTTVSWPRWAFSMLRRNVISGRTFSSPRTYRAYYAGIYAGYENFTFSTGRKGYQGNSYNFGLSGGWSVPLYYFRNGHSLDLDMGLAIGAKMVEYDEFGYEEETGCYVRQKSVGRGFLPYPMVQEIRLGFVFRFRSIKRKVQGGAERYETWEDSVYIPRRSRREKKRERNWILRDSTFKVRVKERSYEKMKRDSLRDDRLREDSLAQIVKSLEAKQKEKENYRNDSVKKSRRDAEREARLLEKEAERREKAEKRALKEKAVEERKKGKKNRKPEKDVTVGRNRKEKEEQD